MDFKQIQAQMELSKKAVGEMKNQLRIFDSLIDEAMKGAPDEDKPEISKVKNLSIKAVNLAKQGKADEAQQLIKDFQNGR